jgi:hypothetical protein
MASNLSKHDIRYWLRRIFKPRSVKPNGQVYVAGFYFARFQYAGRRMTMSLGTANQTEAAQRAKERYLYLTANGWRAFLEKYRADHEPAGEPATVKANITVGEFIEAASRESSLSPATIGPYVRAFRRIVASVSGIKGGKKRFDYRNGANRKWHEKVHAVRLSEVTPEKVASWKRDFIAAAGSDVIARRRATSQVGNRCAPAKRTGKAPKRYRGTVSLDPEQLGRDAGRIAEEVITHLTGLVGSSIKGIRLSIRIGRPLAGKFDKSLDSSCPGSRRQFADPIDREVG